jgi:hypothetical protein
MAYLSPHELALIPQQGRKNLLFKRELSRYYGVEL